MRGIKIKGLIISALAIMLVFSACNRSYRSSRMFMSDEESEYHAEADTTRNKEFTIAPNDIIDFKLFTNDGFKLIDLSTMNDNTRLNQQQTNFFYLVEHDGNVKMPMIGRVNLAGMTIREAEKFLEEKYAKYYIDPFTRVQVENRRVIVFTGEYSQGEVVELKNRNMTLIEGLALAGGISRGGKAHSIKLIRGNPDNPQVFHFDLSKLENFHQGTFVLHSNDIIYVEPRISLTSEALKEWAPVIAMATSILTLYILIISFPSN